MRKTVLAYNKQPAFTINVKFLVTIRVFTTALSDHFYSKNESFPDKLSKGKAKEILNSRLLFCGRNGDYDDGFFDGSIEEGEKYDVIYRDALKWVQKAYPYLNQVDGINNQ